MQDGAKPTQCLKVLTNPNNMYLPWPLNLKLLYTHLEFLEINLGLFALQLPSTMFRVPAFNLNYSFTTM